MNLYFVHTESNDYCLVVKASNEDEAVQLADIWFNNNITSLDNPGIKWIVELCDNDEILE